MDAKQRAGPWISCTSVSSRVVHFLPPGALYPDKSFPAETSFIHLVAVRSPHFYQVQRLVLGFGFLYPPDKLQKIKMLGLPARLSQHTSASEPSPPSNH